MADLPNVNASEIDKFREIANGPDDGPVFMLNLNKYRPAASYPSGTPYQEYMQVLDTLLSQVGAKILWRTAVQGPVVGDQDIDESIGIWYPSHQSFLNLMLAPASADNMRLRAIAVERAWLHRCQAY